MYLVMYLVMVLVWRWVTFGLGLGVCDFAKLCMTLCYQTPDLPIDKIRSGRMRGKTTLKQINPNEIALQSRTPHTTQHKLEKRCVYKNVSLKRYIR
ncbi:hypothetical protein F4810DRAFT_635606 [Camillea tinctor]|nr:hypothetical protein F4810DRAFT_635606 [Camillea tinctor]